MATEFSDVIVRQEGLQFGCKISPAFASCLRKHTITMSDKRKNGLDRRDLIIASIATVGAAATFAATADSATLRIQRLPPPPRQAMRRRERSTPAR